jgi:hypothetical protein
VSVAAAVVVPHDEPVSLPLLEPHVEVVGVLAGAVPQPAGSDAAAAAAPTPAISAAGVASAADVSAVSVLDAAASAAVRFT